MLDTGFHQGAGLHSFTPQAQLRVLAMASQDRASSGLEMLWQICANLQRLGYPVVVLDGTALETDEAPGLSHLLQQAPWNDGLGVSATASATSVAVLPAARGLHQLQRQAYTDGTPPLQGLLPHFRAYGLVVLHAPAGLLGPLLTHTSTMPLAVMEGGSAGVLTCYKSLKQIATHSGLPCTVASVLQKDTVAERRKTMAALRTLQDCAERHLGGRVRTTTVSAHNSHDVQRLALQLLENAGTITGPLGTLPSTSVTGLSGTPLHFVRSH
jgi:hypothetical protein